MCSLLWFLISPFSVSIVSVYEKAPVTEYVQNSIYNFRHLQLVSNDVSEALRNKCSSMYLDKTSRIRAVQICYQEALVWWKVQLFKTSLKEFKGCRLAKFRFRYSRMIDL